MQNTQLKTPVTYSSLNAKLSEYLQQGKDLRQLRTEWNTELKRVDTFISMFLVKFGGRIIGDKRDTPEWKLYSTKTETFSNYTKALRQVDYFIAKHDYTRK